MTVIAWSQNLTTEIASAAGTTLADKHALFRQADFVTIHLVLSRRTRRAGRGRRARSHEADGTADQCVARPDC
jgi:hypothetical protein